MSGSPSRRRFLQGAFAATGALIVAACTSRHRAVDPFTSYDLGDVDTIRATIKRTGQPFYVPQARV